MALKRYYFDLRDGNALAPDEEGVELPDIESVQEEAALSLADMARNADRTHPKHGPGHCMAIEVRDESGPILKVLFTFEADRRRH
jgi:hypothetical protein